MGRTYLHDEPHIRRSRIQMGESPSKAAEHICSAAFVCLFNDLMINLIYRPVGGFETHESV